MFVDAYLENNNYGKFKGIIVTLLFVFHLISNFREYKRIRKARNSQNSFNRLA
jgi:hypothetical protein